MKGFFKILLKIAVIIIEISIIVNIDSVISFFYSENNTITIAQTVDIDNNQNATIILNTYIDTTPKEEILLQKINFTTVKIGKEWGANLNDRGKKKYEIDNLTLFKNKEYQINKISIKNQNKNEIKHLKVDIECKNIAFLAPAKGLNDRITYFDIKDRNIIRLEIKDISCFKEDKYDITLIIDMDKNEAICDLIYQYEYKNVIKEDKDKLIFYKNITN